jgi:signal peptidase II
VAIFSILFIYYKKPDEKKMVRTGLILIFSGAIGNLIDRIAYAEVVDFVDIYFGNYHWPAFNFADACITIGVGFMIIDLFQGHPEEKDPPLFKGGQGDL